MSEKSIYLFMTGGGSNKEYHAHLRQMGDGWVVQYANGPRGKVCETKLNSRTVTPKSFKEATAVYDALVKSKLKDGYTEDEGGVRYTNSDMASKASGHIQQQPKAIDEARAEALVNDSDYAMQEKANGERRTVKLESGKVLGINKLGLYVNTPETWQSEFSSVGLAFGNLLIDGEQIGDKFFAFDLLSINLQDIKHFPFRERYRRLDELVTLYSKELPSVKVIRAHFTPEGKAKFLAKVREENLEGVVFKKVEAPYDAGRSDDTLKFKLVESSTFFVVKKNNQRSVVIGLYGEDGTLISRGNTTIPLNAQIPEVGDLIDVEYLYYNPGGAFEQAVFLRPRNDILKEECTFAQVTRIKPGVYMDGNGERIDAPFAESFSDAPRG